MSATTELQNPEHYAELMKNFIQHLDPETETFLDSCKSMASSVCLIRRHEDNLEDLRFNTLSGCIKQHGTMLLEEDLNQLWARVFLMGMERKFHSIMSHVPRSFFEFLDKPEESKSSEQSERSEQSEQSENRFSETDHPRRTSLSVHAMPVLRVTPPEILHL
jgi:hypothetical protein